MAPRGEGTARHWTAAFLLCGLVGATATEAAGSEAVVKLDAASFQQRVLLSKGWAFVKFYAPWCQHCSEMGPAWTAMAAYFKKNPIPGEQLLIAEVDCTTDGTTCIEAGVGIYPTLALYRDGWQQDIYASRRTALYLKQYVWDKVAGIDAEPDAQGIYRLNSLNWGRYMRETGQTPTVVKFFADGCPRCRAIEEMYTNLATHFALEEGEDVRFAEVNCLDQGSEEICQEENTFLPDYPAFHIYKDGEIEDYFTDESTQEALTNFVWETVDPSRAGESQFQETMSRVLGSLSAGMTAAAPELEDCDCDSDPACICEEETGGEDEDRETEHEEETEDGEQEKEDDTEDETEEHQTDGKEEKQDKTYDDEDGGEDETNLFDMEDESEIIYRERVQVFEERVRVLEGLLKEETEDVTKRILQQLAAKARTDMEAVEAVDAAEVLGPEALEVLKAQTKTKDEL